MRTVSVSQSDSLSKEEIICAIGELCNIGKKKFFDLATDEMLTFISLTHIGLFLLKINILEVAPRSCFDIVTEIEIYRNCVVVLWL